MSIKQSLNDQKTARIYGILLSKTRVLRVVHRRELSADWRYDSNNK